VTPPLETGRLLLRPLELADAAQAQLLFPQWDVVRYLTNQIAWPFPPDGVFQFYSTVALPDMDRNEAWHWSLRLKSAPDQLIGAIGVQLSDDVNRGFWLAPQWRGQGLMTEACDVVTGFWFDELKFPLLRVPKAAVNQASRRISERQGMRIVAVEERDYVSGRLLTEVWELTAEEWRARRGNLKGNHS
jgi:RimJ/RimL family protein N-acetyltransferase